MNTNLPQLAAASDLAAAAQLRRRSDLADAARRLNLTADLMTTQAPVEVDPGAGDVWADEAAGLCTCTEGMCVEADCVVCHTLDQTLPCPADVLAPTSLDPAPLEVSAPATWPANMLPPSGITVDVGEVVDAEVVEDGDDDPGQWTPYVPPAHPPVTTTGTWPPPPAHVASVHAVAAADLTAAGYVVEVDQPANICPRCGTVRPAPGVCTSCGVGTVGTPASPGTGHLPTLDWSSRHDPRSLAYGVRELLAAGPLQLADVTLPVGPVLDQGAEGQCVGMAVVTATNVLDELAGNLDGQLLAEVDADRLYRRAQQLDARAGEGYVGTSVLGGMRAAVEAGLFRSYLWAFGTRDIASTILGRRPVIVGIPWLSGMYETGPGGRVDLAGDDVGLGHCLTLVGLRMTGPQGQPGPWFVWQNTWGTDYGDGGLGYVHHRDLAQLLRKHGEAAVPMTVTVP